VPLSIPAVLLALTQNEPVAAAAVAAALLALAVAALDHYLNSGRPRLVTPRTPAAVFLTRRGTPFAPVTLWLRNKQRARRAGIARNVKHIVSRAAAS
jgi:site-specific recombinase XerD